MNIKKLKQSETKVISRSEINLNPINPKRHSETVIQLQKKNLKKVGYLGGIVWNESTGNLIDGHRRVYAMGSYYKYDGSPQTDYDVKVEVVNLDEKTEKEQLTYMAVGNTKADIDLISSYISDIDYLDIGLDEKSINEILSMAEPDLIPITESLDFGLPVSDEYTDAKIEVHKAADEGYESRKEHMKAVKAQNLENSIRNQLNEEAFITLSFSSFDAKASFCQMIGVPPESKYAKGEDVSRMIE